MIDCGESESMIEICGRLDNTGLESRIFHSFILRTFSGKTIF